MPLSRTGSRHDSLWSAGSRTSVDAVSLALKASSSAFELCRDTQTLVQGNKKAPADIRNVAADLRGFCGVLGALQSTIEDSRKHLDRPSSACYQLQNIGNLLEDCVVEFKEINERANDQVTNRKSIFKKLQSQKEDIRFLREHLSHVKLSLNLALSSLDILIVSSNSVPTSADKVELECVHGDIRQLRSKLTKLPTHISQSERDSITSLSGATIASLASIATVTTMDSRMHDFVETTLTILDSPSEPASPKRTNSTPSSPKPPPSPVHPSARPEVAKPFQIYGHLRFELAMRPLPGNESAAALDAGDAVTIDGIYDSTWVVARPVAKIGSPGLIMIQAIEVRNLWTGKVVEDVGAALAKARVPTWYMHYDQAAPF